MALKSCLVWNYDLVRMFHLKQSYSWKNARLFSLISRADHEHFSTQTINSRSRYKHITPGDQLACDEFKIYCNLPLVWLIKHIRHIHIYTYTVTTEVQSISITLNLEQVQPFQMRKLLSDITSFQPKQCALLPFLSRDLASSHDRMSSQNSTWA